MFKDNFYYILKDRLEYAQDYLIDTSAYIKSIKFQDKVEKEFFRDKILLYLFIGIINLPSDLIRNYRYFKSLLNIKGLKKRYKCSKKNSVSMIKKNLVKLRQKVTAL